MLPETLQDILNFHCHNEEPMFTNVYGTRFRDIMHSFERYEAFLKECGHDTHELAGAIARTNAAIRELKYVNEWMTDKLNQDPFAFMSEGGSLKVEDESGVAKQETSNAQLCEEVPIETSNPIQQHTAPLTPGA